MSPQYSRTGYAAIRTLSAKLASSAGISTHWPLPSYIHPWYMQRMFSSSTQPTCRCVKRCAQRAATRWGAPLSPRYSVRSSPRMRIGIDQDFGTSAAAAIGCQNLRRSCPMGVPGPVFASSSSPLCVPCVPELAVAFIPNLLRLAAADSLPEVSHGLPVAGDLERCNVVLDVGAGKVAWAPRRILEA